MQKFFVRARFSCGQLCILARGQKSSQTRTLEHGLGVVKGVRGGQNRVDDFGQIVSPPHVLRSLSAAVGRIAMRDATT